MANKIQRFTFLLFAFLSVFAITMLLTGCGGGSAAPVSQNKPPVSSPPPTTPPPTTPPPTTPPPTTPPPTTPPPTNPPPTNPPPTNPPPTNPPPTNPPPSNPPPSDVIVNNLGKGGSITTVFESNWTIDAAIDTGSGIALRQSTDAGATFSDAKTLVKLPQLTDMFFFMLDSKNNFYLLTAYSPEGQTLPTVQLTTASGTVNVPSQGLFPQLLVLANGTADIVWLDFITSDLHEIHTSDGKTFSKDRILWHASGSDAINVGLALGTQQQIYVFWVNELSDGSTCSVDVLVSTDGAQNFSPAITISDTDGCSTDPILKIEKTGAVDVAWNNTGSEIDFTRSTDQGQTFSAPVVAIANLIELNTQDFAFGPNGEIDLVYDASAFGDNFDVFFSQSLDSGKTFSAPTKLNLPTVANFTGGGDPSVGVDANGKITVAWDDDSNGKFSGDDDIYIRTSSDGLSFSDATNLTNTTNEQEIFPMIYESTQGRFITWVDTANSNNPNAPTLSVFFDPVQ